MATSVDDPNPIELFLQRLPEYFARLGHDDIIVTDDQRSRLTLLISRLVATKTLPTEAEDLARMIVPVIAGTPTQQKLCHNHIRSMIGQHADTTEPAPSPVDAKAQSRKQWQGYLLQTGLRRIMIATLLVIATALTVLAISRAIDPPPVAQNEKPRSERPAANTTVIHEWIQKFPIDELTLPTQSPLNRTWRWYFTEFTWQKTTVAALPWLVYILVIAYLAYLVTAYLRREAARFNLQALPLNFTGTKSRFGDRTLISDLQPLRGLARDAIREIDPISTATATAEKGGMLTLKWQTRPVPADFLVFIDRRGENDHFAAYGETMVQTLRDAGLAVELFEFDRTPHMCKRVRSGEFEALSHILTSAQDAVFLFYLPKSDLFEPGSGALKSWIDVVAGEERVYFVLPGDLSEVRPSLQARGSQPRLAQASPGGLRTITASLFGQKEPVSRPMGLQPTLEPLLEGINERADRWMQAVAPPREEIDRLLSALQAAVGADGYRWISATAIYPQLLWPMTLHLRQRAGDCTVASSKLDTDLLEISQLPWYRRGWMPDWLRDRFIARLSDQDRQRIRGLLIDAMGLAGSTPRSSRLDITTKGADGDRYAPPRMRSDSILIDYMLPVLDSVRRFFALPDQWIRNLAANRLRKLTVVAGAGAILSIVTSFGALSLMPIDECDLWGTSTLQTDPVGPTYDGSLMSYGGYREKVVAACRKSLLKQPDNDRYRFQYARAIGVIDEPTPERRLEAEAILSDLDRKGYRGAANSLGWIYEHYYDPPQINKAIEAFEREVERGTFETMLNLILIYNKKEYNTDFYREKRKKLIGEYIRLGGTSTSVYWRDLKDGGYGVEVDHKKYLELVQLGADRGDGRSLAELGYLIETGEICDGCEPSPAKANEKYLAGATQDASTWAAFRLARNLYDGNGVKRDVKQAVYWAIFSARGKQQGAIKLLMEIVANPANASTLNELGLATGTIVSQLTQAARNGDRNSGYHLGLILENQNKNEEAIDWYKMAAKLENQDAIDALDRLGVDRDDWEGR